MKSVMTFKRNHSMESAMTFNEVLGSDLTEAQMEVLCGGGDDDPEPEPEPEEPEEEEEGEGEG